MVKQLSGDVLGGSSGNFEASNAFVRLLSKPDRRYGAVNSGTIALELI